MKRATLICLVLGFILIGSLGVSSYDGWTGAIRYVQVRDNQFFFYEATPEQPLPVELFAYADTQMYKAKWSPDGTRVVFQTRLDSQDLLGYSGSYRGEIVVIDFAQGGVARITNLTNNDCYDGDPAWSADGTQIVFVSHRDDSAGELYVMGSNGQNVQRLTRDLEVKREPSWSPDGTRIIYSARLGWPVKDDLYRLRILNLNDQTRLSVPGRFYVHDLEAAWSPDGSRIAFRAFPSLQSMKEGGLYIVDPDGGNRRKIEGTDRRDGRPSWSPDGKMVVFERMVNKRSHIYIVNPDDGTPGHLTYGADDEYFPNWVR